VVRNPGKSAQAIQGHICDIFLQCKVHHHACVMMFLGLPYISEPYLEPSLAFKASTDPVNTSAQATFAPHQTTEQEESADTTFMEI
jgi:hypothetical protein